MLRVAIAVRTAVEASPVQPRDAHGRRYVGRPNRELVDILDNRVRPTDPDTPRLRLILGAPRRPEARPSQLRTL
eukprot:CAMPEP_0180309452 /NCGR_PEP_ID=MMETSP0988-20121125/29120_1 /TAXON_ID=697907 /ORGANISM="non described non described, Strain CCMP2293" /LENGTH=73 /DNA_ID=CAMNT_0022293259 /DNA_START=203 /DNA_END=420 /DNA_ORIENTATION=-